MILAKDKMTPYDISEEHLITKQKKAASVAEAPIANTTTLVPLAKMPPTA